MKKNLFVLFLALAFALTVAEVVLRWVKVDRVKFQEKPRLSWVNVPENSWVEHHPVLGWYPQKNKTALLDSPYFPQVIVHTNSAGFRGTREYDVQKPEGVIRIAALGDSFVFGFGVQDTETFSALLEADGGGREVLNCGVPGYGIDQIYLSYREVAKNYHPDIVLIGVFPEDFWRCTRSFADSGHVKPYFSLTKDGKLALHNVPVPLPFSFNTGQFPPVIEQSGLEKLLDQSVLYRIAKKPLIKLAKNMRLIDPDSTDEWRIGRAILSQLIKEVREDGATPVLLFIPPRDLAESARRTSLERSMRRFVERERVDWINLRPEFYDAIAKDGPEAYYIKADWHWTPKGHRLAADVIIQNE